jgi:hypothetical protein
MTSFFANCGLSFCHAPYTLGMVSSPSTLDLRTWRELYRCNDLRQARAVATCIAAMEFDVRLHSASSIRRGDGLDDDAEFRGPFVIEVPVEHWPDLAGVLVEIIQEQREFDEWIELRSQRRQLKIVLILGAAGVVEVFAIWQMLDR